MIRRRGVHGREHRRARPAFPVIRLSTLLLAATSLLLFAAWALEQGARVRTALAPAILGLGILAAPFAAARGAPASPDRVLNLYLDEEMRYAIMVYCGPGAPVLVPPGGPALKPLEVE